LLERKNETELLNNYVPKQELGNKKNYINLMTVYFGVINYCDLGFIEWMKKIVNLHAIIMRSAFVGSVLPPSGTRRKPKFRFKLRYNEGTHEKHIQKVKPRKAKGLNTNLELQTLRSATPSRLSLNNIIMKSGRGARSPRRIPRPVG